MPNATLLITESSSLTLHILSDIYVFLAAVSLFVLFYLVKFIIIDETLSQGVKLTSRAIFNKFNTAISGGGLFLMGYYAFEAVAVLQGRSITTAYSLGAHACLAGIQFCYMCYTWLRGEAIFDITNPRLLPFLRIMIRVSPLVLLTPSIVALIILLRGPSETLTLVSNVTFATSAFLVSSFDGVVCMSFSIYLRKSDTTTELLQADNSRFRITCFYGLVTTSFEVVTIFGTLFAVTRASNLEYQIVMVAVRAFLMCGYGSLVLLKVALHRQKVARATLTLQGTQNSRFSSTPRTKSSQLG
ncbi:hypothetical protein BJ741DRAFT_586941 [Chytriomyces cf. hyalinus JEL632]|nr:hypothetical protein BJ741DRAFT_586941 [Chytriomyces cf. hyalinus JEL632]